MPLVLTQPGPQGAVASSLLTGLIAYWKMDETSGNRADSAGAFTLVDTGGIGSAAGKIGNAPAFAGDVAKYLSVADDTALRAGLRDFTFDGWIYVPTPATSQYIFSKGSAASGATMEYGLFVASSALTWRIITGTSNRSVISATFSANTWHYVCCWYDSVAALLWIQLNADAPVSAACAGTPNTVAAPFRVGVSGSPSLPLTGRVDELARWNRVLTSTEIAARYASGAGLTHPF